MTSDETLTLMRRVADASMGYPAFTWHWGWGEWIALEGLLEASDATGDERYRTFVVDHVASLDAEPPLVPRHHLLPGNVLLDLEQGHDMGRERRLAADLRRLLLGSPRTATGAPLLRPDEGGHIYVDSLYPHPSFLVRMTPGDESSVADFTLPLLDALVDASSPLPFHGFDAATGQFMGLRWGRGVGWCLLGLVDLVAILDPGGDAFGTVSARVRSIASEMRRRQHPSGDWHTVVDDPGTRLEPSVAAFMTAAFEKGMRAGVLDDSFAPAAALAWQAVTRALPDTGEYPVSIATPTGDASDYDALGIGRFPWGQGAVLRAISERFLHVNGGPS
jgi:unsaturated rhamnogalacturonyl hydrolase